MLGSFGHRVRAAALSFASWAPSAGLLLLLASIVAVVLTNSTLGPSFQRFWETDAALAFGAAAFSLSLLDWVNDGAAHHLLPRRRARDQARVHGRASRKQALGGSADRGGDRRHGGASAALLADHSGGSLGDRLGRADGDGHSVRRRPDRDDGPTRTDRAADLPHRGCDRRRHRRDHRRRDLLRERTRLRLPRRSGGRRARARLAQSLVRLPRYAVPVARRRALGVRALGRPPRIARRRVAGRVHPDATAARITAR